MELEFTMMNAARLIFAMVALGVIAYALIDATKPNLQVGISTTMDKTRRHGVFWVKTVEGGVVQRSFILEDPKPLENPSRRVLRTLTNQVLQMGFQPQHIEITVAGKTMVYATDSRIPRLIHTA